MRLILSILLLFSVTLNAQRVFYTSPTGNDANSGTITSPFFSLKKAWSVVASGDTIYMRGGVYGYSEMQYLQSRNGVAGKLIKLWAYPGEVPIITRGAAYKVVNGVNQDLIYCEGNYLYWKGLEIANFSQKSGEIPYPAVRFGYTNNSIFENINYHDNMAGFSVRGASSNNLFLNCDFYRNQDPLGSDGYGTDAYDGADGLQMNFVQGTNNVIRNCRAWWNADDGFDLWENSGLVTMEGNWAFLNGFKPGTLTTAGNGTGFKLGSTSTLTTATLRVLKNNIAAQNRMYGICENAAQCRTTLSNNTVASTGAIGYWFGDWNGSIVVNANNNLSYSNPENRFNSSSLLSGNSWQTGNPVAADFISVDINQLAGARKSDGSLPDINYLRPVAGKWTGVGALAGGQVIINPPPVNSAPTANAGPDITITQPASTVTLQGSGTDADGTIVSYAWSNSIGTSWTGQNPVISAPVTGTYTFTLTVTDNQGASGTDQVTVTVLPAPPPPVSLMFNVRVYSDKTVSTAVRQNTSKTLMFHWKVYSDWTIERVK